MPRTSTLAACLTAMVSVLGCRKSCDDAALAAVADAMQDRSPEGRKAALRGLGVACPELPPAVGSSLVASYGHAPADLRATIYARVYDDADYVDVRRKTCPITGSQWTEAVEADDRDRAVFDACTLERYGLLEEGELFALDDINAYVLHQWLIEHSADPVVARHLTRGLLTFTGGIELMDACLSHSVGCVAAFAKAGLKLPRSTFGTPIRTGHPVEISPSAVRVGPDTALELQAGRAGADAFEHHVSAKIRSELMAVAGISSPGADASTHSTVDRIALFADAQTPFGTVSDVLFTANKAGLREYSLGVLGGRRLAGIPVTPPRAWLPPTPDRSVREMPLQLTFVVHLDRVVGETAVEARTFEAKGDCVESPATCHDHAALDRWLTHVKEAYPHETVVTLRVDPDVPLQSVVSLLDSMRGADCNIVDTEPAPECRFWQPIIDANPPLYWRIDLPNDFELGAAKGRHPPQRVAGGPTVAEAMERYEAEQVAIAKCLTDDRGFVSLLGTTTSITIMWGAPQDGEGSTALRVWTGGANDLFGSAELESCVAKAFGVPAADRGNVPRFVSERQLELVIPIEMTPVAHY